MSPNNRGIEHDPLQIGFWKSIENLLPHPLLRPTIEPLKTLFHSPNRSGRSRHGAPVRTTHSTASRNIPRAAMNEAFHV